MSTETEIRQAVCDYTDHVEEASYVDGLFKAAGMSAVLDVMCRMVRSGSSTERGSAAWFALDVGRNFFMPDEVTAAFREGMIDRGLLDALHECLHRDDYHARAGAANTLGRLGFPQSIPAFTAALGRCFDRDPLLLPDLLGEFFWLQHGYDWEYLERAASGERCLFRWSVVTFLWPSMYESNEPREHEESYTRQKRLAVRLAEDAVPCVRSEARYCLERMLLKELGPQLDRAESKRRYREIKKRFEPAITFDAFRLRFLHRRGDADYTVEELAAFHELLMHEWANGSDR